MEKKSLFERYGDEILTNNSVLNHFAQCRDCRFRDMTTVRGEECGWDKSFCLIYEPPEYKPHEVYKNTESCEYYEKDTRQFEK
ncbi:MAG: hypothetical protein HFF84_15985 [Oscillibacter sp.]|nr:hypothetical protein [Oscillibacter sp.]